MAEVKNGKTGRNDDKLDQSVSERVIDCRLELPKSLRDKGFHELWGPGGPAALFRRLEQENELGPLAPYPLSNKELAQLVQFCDGEPLPSALRSILIQELRGERRVRTGPKVDLSPTARLKKLLLPALYEQGKLIARRYRRRLQLIESRKQRRHRAEQIPTEADVALRYVQKWSPLSGKTLANKLSAMKDETEKRPRAKGARR
ncbi:MAG: hypothetical protein R3D51_00180 [Hyphomicrobiaceae bacterium]